MPQNRVYNVPSFLRGGPKKLEYSCIAGNLHNFCMNLTCRTYTQDGLQIPTYFHCFCWTGLRWPRSPEHDLRMLILGDSTYRAEGGAGHHQSWAQGRHFFFCVDLPVTSCDTSIRDSLGSGDTFWGPCELVVSRLSHDSIRMKELTLVKAGIGSFGGRLLIVQPENDPKLQKVSPLEAFYVQVFMFNCTKLVQFSKRCSSAVGSNLSWACFLWFITPSRGHAWPYPDRMRILKTRTSKSSTLAATWSQNPLSFSVEHAPATICDQGNWMSAWTTCQLSLPICSQKLWTEVRAVLQTKKPCGRAVLMLGEWLGGSTNGNPSHLLVQDLMKLHINEKLSDAALGGSDGSLWRTTVSRI